MTAAQRREARKQARVNKSQAKLAPPPAKQRFTPRAAQEIALKQKEQEKRPEPTKTPEQDAKERATSADSFEDIFLNIVQFLPEDQKGRALSLFSVFRKQDPAQQKEIVDSLMSTAREQTGPLFDLMVGRIEEDRTYQKAAYERQKQNAVAQYDQLVQQTDLNALRDKAKQDRGLATTLRSITGSAFTDRVAGSGIVRRRNEEPMITSQTNKDDIDYARRQMQARARLSTEQTKAEMDANIGRVDVLSDRLKFDQGQTLEEGAQSLFLSLFENQYAGQGDAARDMIPTGALADDVLTESSDEQRRARYNQERLKNDDVYFNQQLQQKFMKDWNITDASSLSAMIDGVMQGKQVDNPWNAEVMDDLSRRVNNRSLDSIPVFGTPTNGPVPLPDSKPAPDSAAPPVVAPEIVAPLSRTEQMRQNIKERGRKRLYGI